MIAWGSTTVNSSVVGLGILLRRPEWADHEDGTRIRTALREVLDHEDETLRMLSSMSIDLLVGEAEVFDKLARRIPAESSSSVREILLQAFVGRVHQQPIEADRCLQQIAESVPWGVLVGVPEDTSVPINTRRPGVGDLVLQMVLALGVQYETDFAKEVLVRWAEDPLPFAASVGRIVAFMRPLMNLPEGNEARLQVLTFDFLQRLTMQVVRVADQAKQAIEAGATPSAALTEDLSGSGWLAFCMARELYHASGAFRPTSGVVVSEESPPSPIFCGYALPIIEQLVEVPAAQIAHHLVKTLVYLSRLEPKRAFLAVGRIVTSGSGYENEKLGQDEVLTLVDSLLVEQRTLILGDPECLAALREIINTFLNAGSDRAISYVQDLVELFR